MPASRFVRLAAGLACCLLALALGACSDDDSAGPGDGDLESADGASDGDGPWADGDQPGDGDALADGDGPLTEPAWLNEPSGRWTDAPFCAGTTLLLEERFEDGEIAADPAWTVDPRVEGNPSGAQDGVAPVAVVEEDGQQGRCLSGDPGDTGSTKPAPRLYLPLPVDSDSRAFHLLTRLPDGQGQNLLWLNDDDDPTGAWIPEIRIFHDGAAEGVEGQRIRIVDQAGQIYGERAGLDAGWHRIELYRFGSDLDGWRLDVDRATIAAFDHAIDSRRPLNYLFVGAAGRLDDVLIGGCQPPDEGRACSGSSDCRHDEICGRDGLCNAPRAIACLSQLQCTDGSECIAEKDGDQLLGEGVCSSRCDSHGDCRPTELCFPLAMTEGVCYRICEPDGGCPEGQTCRDAFGIEACLPDDCKQGASWTPHDSGLFVCECGGTNVLNPYNGRCEDLGSCEASADCADGNVCGGGLCHRDRDVACEYDGECASGMGCSGFELDGALAAQGFCAAPCLNDDDCLAYERCGDVARLGKLCLSACAAPADCEVGFGCVGAEAGVCLPSKCQDNGEWSRNDETGAIGCRCTGGTTPDPFSGRCL
ncbi:MAG: hypothetical protein C4523_09620 [Myxococcales bacterium]|nr:MAG: hypothetical protein C4523_09620 [Myxococcales bacterium]